MAELTSKQRSYLMKLAAAENPLFQIGKSGLTPELCTAVSEALEARELVKGKVLESSMLTAREACEQLAGALGAEAVQAIGTKFVLYRKKPE